MKKRDVIFLCGKNIIGHFKGFFMEIKKVEISMKNPEKWLIICFAQIKKYHNAQNIISDALVILCPCGLHKYLKSTKSRDIHEKPLKIVYYLPTRMYSKVQWKPYTKIYREKMQEILPYTDWLPRMFIDGSIVDPKLFFSYPTFQEISVWDSDPILDPT